jgi:serine/threonine protein kinase
MPSEAVQQLLERGERSGLISNSVAQELISQLTASEAITVDEVAAQMIEKKVLTRYQADQLLAGHGEECLVAGRYRILEKLGEGGMGAVYKAHDTQLDRDVAVKVLPGHHLNDADAVARFQREARALAKLSHPNIIQAYDSGEDKGKHFLVMEYVAGASLAAILRERGALPPTLAADMIYQAALGLQHAHAKGLVHRDLKPGNLLWSPVQSLPGSRAPAAKEQTRPTRELTSSYVAPDAVPRGIVRILDLGLARFLQDQLGNSQVTKEGVGVGTPDYMAPEQFRDALHADAPTDIYGLGCTLYQLISGTVPFPGSSFSEKADAHAKKLPIPLEERCPEMPAGLEFVVSKMMAKHPADRFQTAAEVAEALAPYIAVGSHSAIQLRQTMRFHAGQLTMRAPSRRKRLLAWAGAVVAAACLVGLLILAGPSIFGRGSQAPQIISQVQSTEPDTKASEHAQPKVRTIENGLTVAKDGTGQYTTLADALEKVKAGQTIRVLDRADYPEQIHLSQASRFAHITIESPLSASLVIPDGKNGVVVVDVPGVTIRGFRVRGSGELAKIAMVGNCHGALLDQLTIGVGFGILLWGITGGDQDSPVIVQNCVLSAGNEQGIRISGIQNDYKTARLCRRVLIRNNQFDGARYGIVLAGLVQQVHIVGNRVSGSNASAIALNNLLHETRDILVANNTLLENHHALALLDDAAKKLPRQTIQVSNNLVLNATEPDFVFLDGVDPDRLKGLGDGAALRGAWQFSHNWRELKEPTSNDSLYKAWVPADPDDVLKDRIEVISRDRQSSKFLRLAKDSPLASGGAGGDLPTYVGAVPPEGIEPWDWQKTWNARAAKSGDESKTGKD